MKDICNMSQNKKPIKNNYFFKLNEAIINQDEMNIFSDKESSINVKMYTFLLFLFIV